MTKEQSYKEVHNKSLFVCCPQRWWFRWLIYIQFTIMMFHPDWQDRILGVVPIIAYYTARMPDFCVLDEGIEISIYKYKRLIRWEKIKSVWLTPKQIIIFEGFILLPIIIFPWRQNFSKTQEVLESHCKDKVRRFWFPVPM